MSELIRNEAEAIDCLKKNRPSSGFYMLQESVDMAISALEEIQQYRAIGTVEELRELKEKATAKKVVVWADGTEHCPNCDFDNSCIGYGVCIDCGQKLLWD